jgi:hypothetical protein
MSDADDEKYIVFKRAEFMEWMGFLSTQGPNTYAVPVLHADAVSLSLPDAVVIRRQDLFASPALATYASCISMVAKTTKNGELQTVADYFQRQSELAADEGWKLPDV